MKQTVRRAVQAAANTPIFRPVVEKAMPLAARGHSDGVRKLRHRDGAWEHRFDDMTSVEHEPRLRSYHLAAPYVDDLWGAIYRPASGDVIVDVGAGIGSETLYYAKTVGPTGRLIAYEAHPAIFSYLERSVHANGFDHVVARQCAVSDTAGTLEIEDDLDNFLGNSVGGTKSDDATHRSAPILQVPAVTLDDDLAALDLGPAAPQGRIDFLKMNIEGAEGPAVDGMMNTLSATAAVCISCHDFKYARTGNPFFKTYDRVRAVFEGLGWTILDRDDPRPEIRYQVNATNPDLKD